MWMLCSRDMSNIWRPRDGHPDSPNQRASSSCRPTRWRPGHQCRLHRFRRQSPKDRVQSFKKTSRARHRSSADKALSRRKPAPQLPMTISALLRRLRSLRIRPCPICQGSLRIVLFESKAPAVRHLILFDINSPAQEFRGQDHRCRLRALHIVEDLRSREVSFLNDLL